MGHKLFLQTLLFFGQLIAASDDPMNYFRALQFPPEAWLRFGIYHGSITHIIIRPSGRVSLRSYAESGFMPVNKVTTF